MPTANFQPEGAQNHPQTHMRANMKGEERANDCSAALLNGTMNRTKKIIKSVSINNPTCAAITKVGF